MPSSSQHLRMYLCTRNKNTKYPNYECKMFNNFLAADNYCYQEKLYYNNFTYIIPVCKYTPSFLHKYILNLKLNTMSSINIK